MPSSKTAVSGETKDTRLMLDRLYNAVKELYEDGPNIIPEIESLLKEFEERYGKNSR